MRTFARSLTTQLLVPVLVIVGAGFAGHAVFELRGRDQTIRELTRRSAEKTAALIENATHYDMLLNRKEEVRHTLQRIAASPEIAGVRIVDKHGKIIFSGRDEDVGQVVDMRAEACVLCHAQAPPSRPVEMKERVRLYQNKQGAAILGLIQPIRNAPECASAACHSHPASQTVLGVMDVQISTAVADGASALARRQLLGTTAAVLAIVAAGVAILVHLRIRRPMLGLREGTERVARGDLDSRIAVVSDDELGQLARAFNAMTADLQRSHAELTAWSQSLEDKVARKTEEVAAMQRQQLHVEKMASLGKLAAVVAHELGNPLGGILTYAKLVERKLKGEPAPPAAIAEIARWLSLIQTESTRCGDIVRNLLLFARRGSGKNAPFGGNELVERTAMLIRHKLELAEVTLAVERFAGDDVAVGDAGELGQALLALALNAAEAAAPCRGRVRLAVGGDPDWLWIDVVDDGAGIAPEVLPHIFEPFFSTKDDGGTGIGLAVAYAIAARHGGGIDVESDVGRGSRFRLRVRRRPAADRESGEGRELLAEVD